MAYFVLITGINQEGLALRGLKAKGFEVYCPIGKRVVKHARKQITKQFPVFSRYIFVSFEDYSQACDPIRSTDGVLDILSNNWQPVEVPLWVVEDIKKREAQGKFDIIPAKPKQRKFYKSFAILKNLLNPDAAIQI